MAEEKVVGILGGMGPEATVDLMAKIIRATPARTDQEHLRIIVDCNPKIPDRTDAILGRGPDPTPALVETARNLQRAGADFIVIPCNSAHYFYPQLSQAVTIPVLHMMREVARHIVREWPQVRRVGLLAATGTVRSGLYARELGAQGRETLTPEEEVQQRLMEAIRMIKAGARERARDICLEAGRQLARSGAEVVVAGCTEIPLVLGDGDLPVPAVDATVVLARAAVRTALGREV